MENEFIENCNNDDIYEYAREKIRRDRKYRPTACYGPRGATGPTGPATIAVGETITGDPGTDAAVTNVGTNQDAILNFVIPTGATGPTGPTGPTPTIDSILVDNDGTQTVTANSLVNLGTEINSTGTTLTFTAPNIVTLQPGTYLISYESLISNLGGSPGDVGASLLINDTVVPNASEYVPATTTQTQINLQHNVTLNTESTLTIQNNSSVSNSFHDSSLSIIRLG